MEVSADFGFGDLQAPNVWDCRNGLVLFEFGGETFHRVGLTGHSPLLYPNMDKALTFAAAGHSDDLVLPHQCRHLGV